MYSEVYKKVLWALVPEREKMSASKRTVHQNCRGVAMVLSMVFILIFSALAVALAGMTGTNAELASNQHKINSALAAAQSGIECAKYIAATVSLAETNVNFVTDAEANDAWLDLCRHLQDSALDGQAVPSAKRFTDDEGSGDEIVTPSLSFGDATTTFSVRFYRYDVAPHSLRVQATGVDGQVTRRISIEMEVAKDNEIMSYAIASRSRVWLTGDTTVEGSILSEWDEAELSPFNMTGDTAVRGTINTVLPLKDIQGEGYQLETLDKRGNPVFDAQGNRVYSPNDEVKAYHDGINYGHARDTVPGMDISDYDTEIYKDPNLAEIPPCPSGSRVVEYFPHALGDYSQPRNESPNGTLDVKLKRHVYENQHFTDARLPYGYNALFKNCTFDGVLYVDCHQASNEHTNNVRFENCTFNGTIVTEVPQIFRWKQNCLYFTGTATFDNQSGIDEATILAPHFNVNLGNTNPEQSDNNVLKGAIIGGLVDIRGNAQINGSVIAMCDTARWNSGYVTNIGATLSDGGSETTETGDVGVIDICPQADQMLPSGISSRIVIKARQDTYCEG